MNEEIKFSIFSTSLFILIMAPKRNISFTQSFDDINYWKQNFLVPFNSIIMLFVCTRLNISSSTFTNIFKFICLYCSILLSPCPSCEERAPCFAPLAFFQSLKPEFWNGFRCQREYSKHKMQLVCWLSISTIYIHFLTAHYIGAHLKLLEMWNLQEVSIFRLKFYTSHCHQCFSQCN